MGQGVALGAQFIGVVLLLIAAVGLIEWTVSVLIAPDRKAEDVSIPTGAASLVPSPTSILAPQTGTPHGLPVRRRLPLWDGKSSHGHRSAMLRACSN
jgi:hypothetical protein